MIYIKYIYYKVLEVNEVYIVLSFRSDLQKKEIVYMIKYLYLRHLNICKRNYNISFTII